jgi:hypothetical protein
MTFTNGNKATIKDILLCEILGFHCTAVEDLFFWVVIQDTSWPSWALNM